MSEKFWLHTKLEDMNLMQWESLCDFCGKCCLEKLIDEDTEQIHFTNVACRLLDTETAQCSNYPQRQHYTGNCVKLTPKKVSNIKWLPSTCAYRLVFEGKDLPDWHPLITKDKNSTRSSGNSVAGRVISESAVDNLINHICDDFA